MLETLIKLFNAVLEDTDGMHTHLMSSGVVVHGKVSKELAEEVGTYLQSSDILPEDLTKTFYASWDEVTSPNRVIDQIAHYLTSNPLTGGYLPNQNFGQENGLFPMWVIKSVNKEEATKLCVTLLNSGISLKIETIEELLNTLEALDFPMGSVQFNNKEANAVVNSRLNRIGSSVEDLVRALIQHSTGSPLVVKSKRAIQAIKESADTQNILEQFLAENKNAEKLLAESFNRYKPLLLALKGSREVNKVINRVAKRSKKEHKPMPPAAINMVTQSVVDAKELKKSNVFALLRALNALHVNITTFDKPVEKVYRIRTGTLHVPEKVRANILNIEELLANFSAVKQELRTRVKGHGIKVYIPENVDYALPTSAKSFIGNIPMNTIFSSDDNVSVGVYWENAGGATDLDLSAHSSLGDRIGWNSRWDTGGLTYSGDITNAPNGAVEYIKQGDTPLGDNEYILNLNIFDGVLGSKYNLIIGKASLDSDSMMRAENLTFSVPQVAESTQSSLGVMFENEEGKSSFLMTSLPTGRNAVAVVGNNREAVILRALLAQAHNRMSLNHLLPDLGYKIVRDKADADVDLDPATVTADSILNLFA